MRDTTAENQSLTRRTLLLSAGGLTVFGSLAARLYFLQVVKSQDYQSLSEKNRFNFNIVVPSRGKILDRNGEFLAINRQDYRVEMIPERVKDLDFTLEKISEVVPLSPGSKSRIKKDIKKHAKFVPILIEDHLSWEEFAALNIRAPELPGVIPKVGEGRLYPHKGTFAHVLGYVGQAGPKDVENDKDPLLRQPTFRIGKTGVEAAAEQRLRGKSGRLKVEVNSVGRIVREWPDDGNRAVSGNDVSLTLDAGLQTYAADLFQEDSGGVAVIDVMTGEVRTLLSMPIYDGNQFVSGLTQEDMKRLNNDEKRPQFNKVIGGGYPPASTFKMCVMLAALENNLVNPSEKVLCTGKVRVGNRNFHCWKRRGHGPVNLKESLKYSCDVYYYDLAQKMGIDLVEQAARKLGLGQKYDLGISGQTSGIIPTESWKSRRLGQGWRTGDSLNAFIGQGFVLATPLQLAVMAARLANGKKAVTPHLIIGNETPQFDTLGIDESHLGIIQRAMRSVCEEPGGTAFRNMPLGVNGLEMAGKTGTGQVRGISQSERISGVRSNRQLPWKLRDHSIFVGYAPFNQPRFAVGTIVEHGQSGAGRAADITRGLLRRALERDGFIAPDEIAADEALAGQNL